MSGFLRAMTRNILMKKQIILTTLFSSIFVVNITNALELSCKPDFSIRTRYCNFLNKDLDDNRDENLDYLDLKAKWGLKINTGSPFYIRYKAQFGNLPISGSGYDEFSTSAVETTNLYLGYKSEEFSIKTGILSVSSPLKAAIDDEAMGVSIKSDLFDVRLNGFYGKLKKDGDDIINPFSSDSYNADTNLYSLSGKIKLSDKSSLKLWELYLSDKSNLNYEYVSSWTGAMFSQSFGQLNFEYGLVLNKGEVTATSKTPLNAYYSLLKLNYEIEKKSSIFCKLHMTSGNDQNSNEINQFQVIEGNGNIDTGLGVLFGGSPFSQQSYFSSNSVALSEDNLSSGTLNYNDPGLLLMEFGGRMQFNGLPLWSEIVFGYARTIQEINNSNLIGFEFDLHNRYKIDKSLNFDLSFGYFLAGDAFEQTYIMNHSSIAGLGMDPVFKIDAALKLKI